MSNLEYYTMILRFISRSRNYSIRGTFVTICFYNLRHRILEGFPIQLPTVYEFIDDVHGLNRSKGTVLESREKVTYIIKVFFLKKILNIIIWKKINIILIVKKNKNYRSYVIREPLIM